MEVPEGGMSKHAIKYASPDGSIIRLVLGRDSEPNMVAALLTALADVDRIQITHLHRDVSMQDVDVDDQLLILDASYAVLVGLVGSQLVGYRPFGLQLCLGVLRLAVQIDDGRLGGCYLEEKDALVAGLLFYQQHLVYQLRSLLAAALELIQAGLQVLACLADGFADEREPLVSGDLQPELLRGIGLDEFHLFAGPLVEVGTVQAQIGDDLVVGVKLNAEFGVFVGLHQNAERGGFVLVHVVFLQFLLDRGH